MIQNTTYKNKDIENSIDSLVGYEYGFFDKLKLKGVGSKRLTISSVSPNLQHCISNNSDISYANIELRPLGILIRFNKGLQNYTWAIPFYHLVIYKTNGISLHAQGNYVRFKLNKNFKSSKSFFDKLLDFKVKYDYNFANPKMA